MGAAEDIIKAKMKKSDLGYAASVKVAEANTPATKTPVDHELNWVQKMTKQIHAYLTRKKQEGQLPPLEKMPADNYSKIAPIYPDLEKKAADLKAAGKNPAEIDLMKRQIANRRGVK